MKFRSHHRRLLRSGFTLTELLVATALTVLVMTMFAQIYGAAVGSLRKQRSLARNDQAARKLSSILHTDLEYRTLRQPSPQYGNVRGIVPLAPGDTPIIDQERQQGYLYISENVPGVDDDDILQLTVRITNNKSSQWPFVGRANSVGGVNIGQDSNPETDDGILGDGIGVSRAAEVTFFVRNGNLYRRVLLLRDPIDSSPRLSDQPTNGPSEVFSPASGLSDYPGASYYRDFDFAATRQALSPTVNYLWFHGLSSLDNTRGRESLPLAMTFARFGFNPGNGLPVEFDSLPFADRRFIGRFTSEETSSTIGIVPFRYPGFYDSSDVTTNPYDGVNNPNLAQLADLDENGIVDVFESFPPPTRAGEDILLTQVEAFDIKVLDQNAGGAFVDIGRSSTVGDFAIDKNRNPAYLNPSFNNIFDSWHPTANDAVGTPNLGPNGTTFTYPPYRPVEFQFPTTANPVPVVPQTFVAWEEAYPFVVGDKIPVPTLANYGTETYPSGYNEYPAMYYEVVAAPPGGESDDDENYYLSAFPPRPGNLVQDGDLVWKCVDNRVGLQAIRITIRFRDTVTDVPRQVTITHSFVE